MASALFQGGGPVHSSHSPFTFAALQRVKDCIELGSLIHVHPPRNLIIVPALSFSLSSSPFVYHLLLAQSPFTLLPSLVIYINLWEKIFQRTVILF